MVASTGYVPILLTKRGERSAVQDLSASARAAMKPLFVVEPIPWDFDEDRDAKSVDAHLNQKPQQLVDCWGVGPAFVDLLFVGDGPMANGEHPLVWFTANAAALGLPLVPVVAIGRTPAYRAAVAAVVARDGLGACLRLPIGEWPKAMPGELSALMSQLGVPPGACDLLLDLQDEVAAAPVLAESAVRAELTAPPPLLRWRSVIVAGASFPKEGPRGAGVHVLKRHEWALYRNMHGVNRPLTMPTYGDYAIANPDPLIDVNPAYMNISATIRYTAEDSWLVAKGELFKGTAGRGIGGAAVPPVAASLVAHAEFTPGHCAGEGWVNAAATGGPTGNPETWRRYGTLHHLERVTDQLASLHGTSSTP